MLTKEAILGCNDSAPIQVEVPEWGGVVYIRKWNCETAERMLEAAKDHKSAGLLHAVNAICDEKGNLIFTEADIPELKKKSAKAVSRIIEAIAKNTFVDSETEVKNLQSTQSDESGTN